MKPAPPKTVTMRLSGLSMALPVAFHTRLTSTLSASTWRRLPLIDEFRAQVAELVDAPASGAGARKGVEVRVLSWAPFLTIASVRSQGNWTVHSLIKD